MRESVERKVWRKTSRLGGMPTLVRDIQYIRIQGMIINYVRFCGLEYVFVLKDIGKSFLCVILVC
jgi:hypothetical protein